MDIERIYFDMDDVLVDFTGGAREFCGIEIRGKNAVGDDVLFDSIRELGDFYMRVKPILGSLELFNDVREWYGDKVEILTAVPKPSRNLPTLGEDKIEWVKRYLGGDVVVNIVLRREKVGFVRNRGSVLIDDNAGNIKAWNEAGGTGVLFTDPVSAKMSLERIGIKCGKPR
ncbi:5' nucleotidase, deoxy (Pyrimidine), cytosolic type C protein (NT5C) [Thermoplasmatales archaeon BRNA1]|nr:5' nucleotidase, deoxy (Pyrimidine), cytosolic type C protein (NT5C) [Thermoplasmatales archaeon BRNA1]